MQPWKLVPARDLALPLHERLLSLRRESDLLESLAQLGWWTAVRGYLKLCHGLSVYGRRRLPLRPPFVLVANHTSHLDALVLGSLLKEQWRNRTFPLAAGDAFSTRVGGLCLPPGYSTPCRCGAASALPWLYASFASD
jgi:1-acyl-sn-glycerol-3-phosphate acyltransferase